MKKKNLKKHQSSNISFIQKKKKRKEKSFSNKERKKERKRKSLYDKEREITQNHRVYGEKATQKLELERER